MRMTIPDPAKLRDEADAEIKRLKDAGDAVGLERLASQLRNLASYMGMPERRARDAAGWIRYKAAQKGPPTFDLSVRELQLYEGSRGGKKAAKAISAALTQAAKAFHEWYGARKKKPSERTVGQEIGELWGTIVSPVLSKYAKAGAEDTEPRNVTQDILERMASDKHGENAIKMYEYNPRRPNPEPTTTAGSLGLVNKLKF